jgi:curved DNA-binding protein CbpA
VLQSVKKVQTYFHIHCANILVEEETENVGGNISTSSTEMDLYQILGLPANPAGKHSSYSDIKKAYYKQALRYHPDKQSTDASKEQLAEAQETFQRIGQAYAILNDKAKRRRYDQTGQVDVTDHSTIADWKTYFNGMRQLSIQS